MGDLGPLCGSDVLAHVDDAIHSHLGVGLNKAGRGQTISVQFIRIVSLENKFILFPERGKRWSVPDLTPISICTNTYGHKGHHLADTCARKSLLYLFFFFINSHLTLLDP